MNSEFYEIYGEMLEEYRDDYRFGPRRFFRMFSPSSDQSFRLIEKAVEEVCEQKKVKLRPDAKYFLITNFHQMVATSSKENTLIDFAMIKLSFPFSEEKIRALKVGVRF